MATEETAASTITVRKYSNRRLYRTDESRYVTLDELAEMVRGNVDFEVLDARDGADITGVVLAQVILEEEKRSHGTAFPVDLLRQIIRLQDDNLTDFIVNHLPRLTEIYLEARTASTGSLDTAAAIAPGEAAIISQLAAVKSQLSQILDSLELEEK